MLKRRASSPPPSSGAGSVPLVIDPTPSEKMRDTKRRRILPPVLDGQLRGWGTPQDSRFSGFDDEDDDGEEDVVDSDDEPDTDPSSSISRPESPYKSANSFLHELHTLQQHRLLFPSNSASQSSQADRHIYIQGSKLLPRDEQVFLLKHPHSSPSSKGAVPPFSGPSHMQGSYDSAPLGNDITKSKEEVHSVMEHYEETNRLLGSLVLSRRRELEPSYGKIER